MKHIFLTGEIQVGKSTVIQKTLDALDVDWGGFRTYFSQDRTAADRRLYIRQAGQESCFDEDRVVARFHGGKRPPEVYPERFDALGTQYIKDAASGAEVIVMDELGDLERNALRFQDAVFGALEGENPVLGVIKLLSGGWVDRLRAHPNVALITVNTQNRDELPVRLARELRGSCPNMR